MVESVDKVTHSSHRAESAEEKKKDDSYDVSQVSYSLVVIEVLSKIGMSPVEQNITDQGNLEQQINKLQGELTSVSAYLSKFENNAKSSDVVNIAAVTSSAGRNGILDKNAFNGLDPDFFNSKDFDNTIKGFVSHIKSIFFAKTDSSNMTLGEMMNIHTPDGKNIDLTSYWQKVGNEFNNYFQDDDGNPLGDNKIILDPTQDKMSDHGSLLQCYLYCKLQVKVDQTSIPTLKKDNYDLMKVLDPNPKGESGGDGIATELMDFLSSLDTKVTVSRTGWNSSGSIVKKAVGWYHWDHNAGRPAESTTSGNILEMIVNNQYKDVNPGAMYTGNTIPGLDTAFGYMAFNYFWTNNPNMKGGSEGYEPPALPPGYSFQQGLGGNWINSSSMPGVAQGNLLSDLYTNANGLETLAGNDSQSGSTELQEQTSVMGQYQNIGQNILKGDASEKNNTISGYKAN